MEFYPKPVIISRNFGRVTTGCLKNCRGLTNYSWTTMCFDSRSGTPPSPVQLSSTSLPSHQPSSGLPILSSIEVYLYLITGGCLNKFRDLGVLTFLPISLTALSHVQVEELKNKNLLLRAQLRHHGVEVVIKSDSN